MSRNARAAVNRPSTSSCVSLGTGLARVQPSLQGLGTIATDEDGAKRGHRFYLGCVGRPRLRSRRRRCTEERGARNPARRRATPRAPADGFQRGGRSRTTSGWRMDQPPRRTSNSRQVPTRSPRHAGAEMVCAPPLGQARREVRLRRRPKRSCVRMRPWGIRWEQPSCRALQWRLVCWHMLSIVGSCRSRMRQRRTRKPLARRVSTDPFVLGVW